MVGLKDIAAASNVSLSTVSRALAAKSTVNDETRDRVLRHAARLGYRPNLLVRGMQTQRTHTVGVVTRNLGEFNGCLIEHLSRQAERADYVPYVLIHEGGSPDRDDDEELRLIHRLIDRRVDGLIVIAHHTQSRVGRYREIWERNLPLVWLGKEMPGDRGDLVASDNLQAGRQAAEHLLELGHTRVAHLAGNLSCSTGRLRRQAFCEAVETATGRVCPALEVEDFVDGTEQAKALLDAADRPTAVFAANDYLALTLLRVARQRGLRVPDDLSVCGMADLSFADQLPVSLTTIDQQASLLGRSAFDQLRRRLQSDQPTGRREQVLVPTRLIRRASTAPPPSEVLS